VCPGANQHLAPGPAKISVAMVVVKQNGIEHLAPGPAKISVAMVVVKQNGIE